MHCLLIRLVQRLPAGEAGLDIMPVLNALLAQLPAQVDHPAILYIWKITQPFAGIFEQHTQVLNLLDQGHEVGNGSYILDTELTVSIQRRVVAGFLDFRIKLARAFPLLADFFHELAERWK